MLIPSSASYKLVMCLILGLNFFTNDSYSLCIFVANTIFFSSRELFLILDKKSSPLEKLISPKILFETDSTDGKLSLIYLNSQINLLV